MYHEYSVCVTVGFSRTLKIATFCFGPKCIMVLQKCYCLSASCRNILIYLMFFLCSSTSNSSQDDDADWSRNSSRLEYTGNNSSNETYGMFKPNNCTQYCINNNVSVLLHTHRIWESLSTYLRAITVWIKETVVVLLIYC